MTSPRRLFLAAAWSVPILACVAASVPAVAGEDVTGLEATGRKRDRTEGPVPCPACRPGQLCQEHLV